MSVNLVVYERLDKYRADVLIKMGSKIHNPRMVARGINLKLARLRRKGK